VPVPDAVVPWWKPLLVAPIERCLFDVAIGGDLLVGGDPYAGVLRSKREATVVVVMVLFFVLRPPRIHKCWLIQKKNQRGKCKAAEQDRPVPGIETKKTSIRRI